VAFSSGLLTNSEFRRPETSAISVYDQSRFSVMIQVDFPVFGPNEPDTTPHATAPGRHGGPGAVFSLDLP